LEKLLPKTEFVFCVDADVEVFEPMKEGPGARTHKIPVRKGDLLTAYVVKETPQHYFIKFDDGGLAFLHKIAVAVNQR
jgi:hypothetical protein